MRLWKDCPNEEKVEFGKIKNTYKDLLKAYKNNEIDKVDLAIGCEVLIAKLTELEAKYAEVPGV